MESALQVLSAKEAALRRRSVRRFRPDPVPMSLLKEVLATAQAAPSAWNLQPWRLVAVLDPGLKKALRAAAFGQEAVETAPVVLVVYSDMKDALAHLEEVIHPGLPPERRPAYMDSILKHFQAMPQEEVEAWGAGQSYIYLGYLLLLLKAYGLDSVPMLGFDPARVKALLGLPDHVRIPALVPLGYGAEEGFPHHRHALKRVLTVR